ncbi:UvrD-helicase domain-containing protein [Macrococcoides caseolyticum]|uniref:UvrD-helicase domain-containing protein n=2 Tax=Macrococcoides caseolyticum TaxID=69966 RepID=UPI0020B78F3B|nr:UvrD-helicase domain-containing protein [Macrococcus caseolyticus]UTH05731.1 UvrD-helicase domain-containing protein [Macrococcus caseolyticus]
MSSTFNEEKKNLKDTITFIEKEIKILNKNHINIKNSIISQRKKMNDNENWMLDFDNSNAVDNVQDLTFLRLEETRYNQVNEKINNYKMLLNRPYFGKLMLEDENIYIGTQTVIDEDHNILVCDWRSSIASLFYENKLGYLKFHNEKGQELREYVKGRRQFKIEKGNLLSFIDSDMFIGDSELINYKAKSTDSKLSNIVSTIQHDQNEIIRLPINEDILVLGPPGSGKTAIAMQRIAYLLFRYKNNIRYEDLMLIAPNSIFNDYVSNVLPELGENNIQINSLSNISKNLNLLNDRFVESKSIMIERLYSEKESLEVFYKKSSYKFYHFMEQELLNNNLFFYFKDIKDTKNNMFMSKEELHSIFIDLRKSNSITNATKKMQSKLINTYNTEYKKMYKSLFNKLNSKDNYIGEKSDLEKQAKQETSKIFKKVKKIIKNYKFIDFNKIYNDMCNKYQLNYIHKEKDIYQEDYWAQVWLCTKILKIPNHKFKHILIDEVQDYSIFQLDIIRQLFPDAHFTFLGDINQSFLSDLVIDFSKITINTKRLTTSYRSTKAIHRYLETLKKTNTKVIGEEGEEVVKTRNTSISYLLEIIKNSIGYVAIVVPSQIEGQKLYNKLSKYVEIYLIKEDNSFIPNGHVIIPYYLVKGFEFSTVVSWNNEVYNENTKYIIGSRAISKLYLING